jgi:hypothetical protein
MSYGTHTPTVCSRRGFHLPQYNTIAITADLYGHINSEFQDGMTDELNKMLATAEQEKVPTTTR